MGKKKSILDFQRMKREGQKIIALTAYDYTTALFEEQAGVDIIEVGDSLGICVYGYPGGTVPVTMDQCILHTQAVRRGAPNTFLVGDMPFMSYQISPRDAVRNAGRFFKEAGVDAILLEGGGRFSNVIRAIVDARMVVCGDIGLPETEQDTVQLGRYKAQGRTAESGYELIEEARAVQEAGASLMVLGPVPLEISKFLTEELKIPVIGVGSGPHCDGQILTVSDVLGIHNTLLAKFVKRYANLAAESVKAIQDYIGEVRQGKFPTEDHCYKMVEGEAERMMQLAGRK